MWMRWNQELHKHHAFDRGLAFCVKNTRMTVQCNPKKAPTVESMERASTNKYLDSRSSKNRVFTEERAVPVKVRKQENWKWENMKLQKVENSWNSGKQHKIRSSFNLTNTPKIILFIFNLPFLVRVCGRKQHVRKAKSHEKRKDEAKIQVKKRHSNENSLIILPTRSRSCNKAIF